MDEQKKPAPLAGDDGTGGTVTTKTPAAAVTPPPKKKRFTVWVWILFVVAMLLAAGGALYGYQLVLDRSAATENLDEATALVEKADEVVLEVDDIILTPIDPAVGERAAAALETTTQATADLEEAIRLIDEAMPDLPDEEIDRAQALRDSAEARVAMLTLATPILQANVKAAEAMTPAMEGWDLLLEAEELSDQAVTEYNKLTKDAVRKSKTLTESSQKKTTEAKAKFEAAAVAYPEAEFTPYIEYCDAKLAALAISIKADDAYLADKPEEANKLSDDYNKADKALVEQAKGLPDSPADVISEAYEAEAGETTEVYFVARERATEADDRLRAAVQ